MPFLRTRALQEPTKHSPGMPSPIHMADWPQMVTHSHADHRVYRTGVVNDEMASPPSGDQRW